MNTRIVSVGSVNLDHVIRVPTIVRPGETILAHSLAVSPGGKSFNQAAAARLLGGDVEFVASVANDAAGTIIRNDLGSLGISTDRMVISQDAATGLAFINVDEDGENAIVVVPGANTMLTMTDGMATAVAAADIVMLALEVPIETVAACARRGAASGGRVILNLSPYRPVPRELLDDSFLVVVNEHELLHLLPDKTLPDADGDWSHLISELAGIGIRRAVVTLGPRGAVVLQPAVRPERSPHVSRLSTPPAAVTPLPVPSATAYRSGSTSLRLRNSGRVSALTRPCGLVLVRLIRQSSIWRSGWLKTSPFKTMNRTERRRPQPGEVRLWVQGGTPERRKCRPDGVGDRESTAAIMLPRSDQPAFVGEDCLPPVFTITGK